MRSLILLLSILLSTGVFAQSNVPELLRFDKDTVGVTARYLAPNGYSVSWTSYQYCTNLVCFNDGISINAYDSNHTILCTIPLEKPGYAGGVSSKVSVKAILIDNNNDIVVSGALHSEIDFSPNDLNTTIEYGNNVYSNTYIPFIAKYRITDGALIWVKTLPDVNNANPGFSFMHLQVDKDNNIYLLLSKMNGSFDIDPGSNTVAVSDDFIAKYSPSGNYITHKLAGEVSYSITRSLHYVNGSLYLTTLNDSAGKSSFVLRKYNTSTLNVIKEKKIGILQEDNSSSGFTKRYQLVANQGNLWILASHVGTLALTTVGNKTVSENLTSTYGARGHFIMKLDSAWNLTDARLVYANKSQYAFPTNIGFDSLNRMLLVGTVKDSMDMDLGTSQYILKPSATSSAFVGYMACYDDNFNLQWAKKLGDSATIYATEVSFGNHQTIYISGVFKGTGNFSMGSIAAYKTSVGISGDMYQSKYRWSSMSATSVPSLQVNRFAGLKVYPNPATDVIRINTERTVGKGELVNVYDVSGKLLISTTVSGNINDLELSVNTLTPGIYYIKLSGDQGSATAFIRN